MQHRRKGRKLHRVKNQRTALMRSLMRAAILKHTILTTEAKAKEVRPHLERLVTKARRGTLTDYRMIISQVGKDGASALKKTVVPALATRTSGYTRVIKHVRRKSDGAKMAFIEFIDLAK